MLNDRSFNNTYYYFFPYHVIKQAAFIGRLPFNKSRVTGLSTFIKRFNEFQVKWEDEQRIEEIDYINMHT